MESKEIKYSFIHIKDAPLTADEIKSAHEKSGLSLQKFFNTSGLVYKNLGLKDKLKEISDEEKYQLLSSDGMLVKRPLLIGDDFSLVGFKAEEWEKQLNK